MKIACLISHLCFSQLKNTTTNADLKSLSITGNKKINNYLQNNNLICTVSGSHWKKQKVKNKSYFPVKICKLTKNKASQLR